jgi:hypothetical protein
MNKPTSSTQLAAFLFVDSRCHEPHDVVQCRAHGSIFEFLFEFQTEILSIFSFEFQTEIFSVFFFLVSSCSSIKPFDYRGSTVFQMQLLVITKYYQQLYLKHLCKLARYWLQALWWWHDSVETCSSVIICEIVVHLLIIVQNNKNIRNYFSGGNTTGAWN